MRFVAALLLTLAFAVVSCASDDGDGSADAGEPAPGTPSGYTRDPVPSVGSAALPLTDGSEVPVAAAPGALRIVYFGYTSCPDVCPTTMADLRAALAELPPEDAERVDVAMVTIDPDRDVPEKLEAYVTTFFPDGAAVRVEDPDALAELAEPFGARYAVDTIADGTVEVSHSGDLYAVDEAGNIVMQWPFGIAADDLSADIRSLLEGDTST